MGKILLKEMKLSASILSYVFIVFGLMFLLPGYPVLCGAFFYHTGNLSEFPEHAGNERYSVLRATSNFEGRCGSGEIPICVFDRIVQRTAYDTNSGSSDDGVCGFSGVQRERVDERERVCTGNGFRPIRAV